MKNTKYTTESVDEISFNLITPSISRWIDDQIDLNYPSDIDTVACYVNMQDPGYNLCTKKGDYLAKDLMNSYLKMKVGWLDDNLDISVSKQGKLAIGFKTHDGFKIIIHYIQYDFSKSFTSNLGILSKETAKYLSDNFTTREIFDSFCMTAIQNAKNESKKIIYLDLISKNPDNKPVFEKLSLRGYSILTESDEKKMKDEILSLSKRNRKKNNSNILEKKCKSEDEDGIRSIEELEGLAVRGVWKDNVLTLDDTGEKYKVTAEAPIRCHGAFIVKNGFLNKI